MNDKRAAIASAKLHSQRVRWLKLAIPLIAAGAVVGLLAFSIFDPFRKLPAGVSVSGYGLDGTRITMEKPRLSGYHKNGQPYQLRAKSAQQDITKQNIIDLNEMEGSMGMDDGHATRISATRSTYDSAKETMVLNNNVQISSDSGYELLMNQAFVDFHQGSLISNEPVTMKLKNGTVLADKLNISDNGRVVTFDGHVRSTFNNVSAASLAQGNPQ